MISCNICLVARYLADNFVENKSFHNFYKAEIIKEYNDE